MFNKLFSKAEIKVKIYINELIASLKWRGIGFSIIKRVGKNIIKIKRITKIIYSSSPGNVETLDKLSLTIRERFDLRCTSARIPDDK